MPSARLLAAAVLLAACKKKLPPEPPPPPVGIEGARCSSSTPCNPGLSCAPSQRCAKPDDPEILAAHEAERAAERRFLEASGVAPSTTVETAPAAPAPSPATSGAVRVVRTSTDGKTSWTFAACRPDERLVSGGCKLDERTMMLVDSYPSHDTATDTLGARWNCGRKEGLSVNLQAFALCQRAGD